MTAPGGLLSRSALEAVACLYRYYVLYVLGIPDDSPETRRGSAFHDAARRYIQRLAAQETDHDADAARESLDEALVHNPVSEPIMCDVQMLFWRWAEKFRLNVRAYLLAEERQGDGGFTFMPDLVYAYPRVLEIWDWKTYYVAL